VFQIKITELKTGPEFKRRTYVEDAEERVLNRTF
jgi:hypothetical protein